MAKPGSHVVVMTWGKPDGMEAASLVAALRPLLPPPPAGAPGPFALSGESALRAFASAAALEPLEVFDVDSPGTTSIWLPPYGVYVPRELPRGLLRTPAPKQLMPLTRRRWQHFVNPMEATKLELRFAAL